MTGGVAVILGLTGRNFAAGMSGGIAYIYDPTGVFPPKCNKESVTLYKLVEDEDLNFLKNILSDFYLKTKSEVAEKILNNWQISLSSFIKVFPNEYKKVLEEKKLKNAPPVETVNVVKSEENNKNKAIVDIEDAVKNVDKVK